MFGYENINLSLTYPVIFLLIALLLIAAYSYYVYRYTIPQINKYKKLLLTALRILALLILCLILFEPILNLSKTLTLEPNNFIFIDNSRSMKIQDGTNREQKVKQILDEFSGVASASNLSFYEFGNKVNEIVIDSLKEINFSDGTTNFQKIFEYLQNAEKNISSITLITDGVITSGENPYYQAVNLGIPVFTIGIGDTTQRKDIELKKTLYNELIYTETPTIIIANISNKGFAGQTVTAALYEDNKFIAQQDLILNNSGFQNISFDYIPQSSGEHKLSIELSVLKDEFTSANNKQIFYVNVLSSKIKVLLIASSPSSDLTFIKNALMKDENIEVNSIVQISNDKFLEKINYQEVDSADVLFLIGFPSASKPNELLSRVITKINVSKTPFFITLSAGVSLDRLSSLANNLPFTIGHNISGVREKEVQPYISSGELNNPIIQYQDKNVAEIWNNLPPVPQPNVTFIPKVNSRIIAQINFNNNIINSPLILSSNFNGNRSIAVLAKDIWKWKLLVAPKGIEVFDNFIVNSLRWLRANEEQKLVKVKTLKKSFSQGERIEFSGEVFDESLNPVSDAEIKINISSSTEKFETALQNIGPGLYEASIVINQPGDYSYSAQAQIDGRILGKDRGNFNIGEIDIEMINPVMNFSFLNLLSVETGGKFYTPDNLLPLLNKLNSLKINSTKEKIVTSEINLWSNTWMLVIAILLFAIEWFIRKRSGML